jgi:membrane AbrB-like protein
MRFLPAATGMTMDAITVQVLRNKIASLVDEMHYHFYRSGYSTIIRESRDFSCVVLDRDGRLIVAPPMFFHAPVYRHLVGRVLALYGPDAPLSADGEPMREGDVFVSNHPYEGGLPHVSDMAFVAPVFAGERLVAFAGSIAHKADIGGTVAGSTSANATEMYQEGLLIPPIRIVEAGRALPDIERLILGNSRQPELAGTPGGLAQVMALASDAGRDCDIRAVAIVQTLRVVILAVCVPAVLSASGLAAATRLPASAATIADAPLAFALMSGACAAAALGLVRLGFPGGLIFGPMLISALLHGTAWVTVTMPFSVATAAMVGIGTLNGGRFSGTPFRVMLRYLGAGLGAFAVSLVVAGAIGASLTALMPLPISEMIVAYAPGAVDAMMILSLALHLDPVFVGAHHLTRVVVVSLGLPVLAFCFSPAPSARGVPRKPDRLPD